MYAPIPGRHIGLPLPHAVPITLFILALFYKWFALDDRYAIFLYGHMNATPFDEVTIGRYWMSGLVASAVVILLYITANFLLARIVKGYRVPEWWRVWLWCALPLAIGIVVITTTQNSPTMPLAIAVACAIAALIGLALALMPGELAAHRPCELLWVTVDGLGLVPPLLLMRAIELPSRGLAVSVLTAYAFEIGSIMAGVFWLVATNVFRAWRREPSPSARAVFIAGLCWSYLVLPLAHHIFFTPADFKYITTSYNFFAYDTVLQAATFIVAALLAVGATKLRDQLSHDRTRKRLP